MQADDKRNLTILEFSTSYGPSRSKVYELMKHGALKAVKYGKRTYIPRDEAERWLQSLPAYGQQCPP